MSLQTLAQDMAARGRGPDTMLVHMAPKEVAGLQALALAHGGSLTINPQTGLPEAGFLKNLLPTLIGAGLAAATGGTSLAFSPAMIGLGVGGLQALRTGSLSKGLMAGLGAYGGAGLMSGVMGAGTGAISAGSATGASPSAGLDAGMGVYNAAPAAPVTPPLSAADAGMGVYDASGFKAVPQTITAETQNLLNRYPAPIPPSTPVPDITVKPPAPMMDPNIVSEATQERLLADRLAAAGPMDKFQAGIKAIADKPSSFLTGSNLKYGAAALAPALFQEPKSAQAPRDTEQYRYAYNPNREMPPYRAGDVGEFQYFRPSYTRLAADGGIMSLYAEGGESTSGYTYNPKTMMYTPTQPKPQQKGSSGDNAGPYMMGGPDVVNQNPTINDSLSLTGGLIGALFGGQAPAPVSDAVAVGHEAANGVGMSGMGQGNIGADMGAAVAASADSGAGAVGAGDGGGGIGAGEGLARGGISHLGDYSDGGRLLKGPGDGVSDSIPATIADKRPARLADGEFVVPARIVSELGNGSTDAGARKLYAMMDRVQKNRAKTVGKGKMAVDSRAEKLLPA